MKIGPNADPVSGPIADPLTHAAVSPNGVAAAGVTANPAPAVSPNDDTVELSAAARSLHDASPPFNAAKVKAISAAIAEGNFKVQAERIADKLISTAAELLERITQARQTDR